MKHEFLNFIKDIGPIQMTKLLNNVFPDRVVCVYFNDWRINHYMKGVIDQGANKFMVRKWIEKRIWKN